MSYTSLMIDTCTVRRFTEGAADAYGVLDKTWADVGALTDIACRLMAGIGRGFMGAGREIRMGAEVVEADYTLYLGDVAVTEQDRVVIDTIEYQIVMVADRQNGTSSHHKECLLRAVR